MSFSFSPSPNYLYHHTSSYIFCLCVPVGLRTLVGKAEFRYSLTTGSLRGVKQSVRLICKLYSPTVAKATHGGGIGLKAYNRPISIT